MSVNLHALRPTDIDTLVSVAKRKVKNTKAKGNRNEARSMAIFEAAGYRCSRSAASLGVFDFIGIGPHDIVLCQVKTRDFPGSSEMQAITEFVCPANCRKIVHRWRDRVALPDVREVV